MMREEEDWKTQRHDVSSQFEKTASVFYDIIMGEPSWLAGSLHTYPMVSRYMMPPHISSYVVGILLPKRARRRQREN